MKKQKTQKGYGVIVVYKFITETRKEIIRAIETHGVRATDDNPPLEAGTYHVYQRWIDFRHYTWVTDDAQTPEIVEMRGMGHLCIYVVNKTDVPHLC